MKSNRQDGHDPHQEFIEWVAAVEAAWDREISDSYLPPALNFPSKLALRRG